MGNVDALFWPSRVARAFHPFRLLLAPPIGAMSGSARGPRSICPFGFVHFGSSRPKPDRTAPTRVLRYRCLQVATRFTAYATDCDAS